MDRLRLVTWNVLHRIHGEKWSRHVIAAFPDERVRIERIAARVAGWLAEGVDAISLQEVSGDQLAAFSRVSGSAHSHRYRRVPGWLKFWVKPLADRSEHLVTISARGGSVAEALTYATDPGKGLLAVDLEGLRLVNTHLTFGEPGTRQLELAAASLQRGKRGVLVGDLNAGRDAVASVLGSGFTLADVGRSTYLPSRRHKGAAIDHVAALAMTLESCEVLEGEGLSDHHPVIATLRVP